MSKQTRHKALTSIFIARIVLITNLVISCSSTPATLSIFAAAGTRPALDEICREFGKQYQTKVEVSYGGGGEVLNQMILSHSGDVYLAPEQRFMETAQEKQAIDPETIKSVAYMIPVIAVPKGNPKDIKTLADLAKPGVRVAVTRPETTLLGKYAPEIFQKAGLSEAIGKNVVTQAARPDNLLTMLIMGQVDAGIIWHFYQLQAPDQIENVYLLPKQLTGIGEIQVAVAAFSHDKKLAQRFIEFITSANGKDIYRKQGYFVDTEEVSKYWH